MPGRAESKVPISWYRAAVSISGGVRISFQNKANIGYYE
jgi:hypothetical protein